MGFRGEAHSCFCPIFARNSKTQKDEKEYFNFNACFAIGIRH